MSRLSLINFIAGSDCRHVYICATKTTNNVEQI